MGIRASQQTNPIIGSLPLSLLFLLHDLVMAFIFPLSHLFLSLCLAASVIKRKGGKGGKE